MGIPGTDGLRRSGPRTRGVLFALAALAGGLGPTTARAQQVAARVTLSTSHREVTVGESFRLEVRAEVEGAPVQSVTPPDVAPFQVVRRSQRQPRQFSFSFGGRVQQFQSTIVDTFILRATRVGSFVLGPAVVSASGRRFESDRVTIIVQPGPGGLTRLPGAGDDPGTTDDPDLDDPRLDDPVPNFDPRAFLRTVVTPTEAHVGEQVDVDVLLYVADRLRGNPSILREATADGFWVQDLVDRRTLAEGERVTVNGRTFYVYALRRFAAFPLRPGEATIGAARVRIPLRGGRLRIGRSEELERASLPVTVDVAPLPDPPDALAGVDDADVAVGRFTIDGKLDRRQVRTGEAVSVSLTVEGRGNVKTVHLELEDEPGDDLEILPPEVEDEVAVRGDDVVGTRTHTWLVVPSRPGAYTLPAVRLPTWNPASRRWRVLEGPALSFVARGPAIDDDADGAVGTTDEPAPSTGGSGGEEDEPTRMRRELGPLRTASSLERRRTSLSAAPWYPAAAAAPPVLFGLWLGLAGIRRRRSQRAEAGDPRQAIREARQRVRRAGDDPGALARALESTLGTVLDEPVGGYTRRELGPRLTELGLPEALRRRIVDELERLDARRFGMPGATAGDPSSPARVRRLLDELERVVRGRGARPRAASAGRGEASR